LWLDEKSDYSEIYSLNRPFLCRFSFL
jgi:hypothetical protein